MISPSIGSDAVPVADLDAAGPAEAMDALRPCCASRAWLAMMVAGRPYRTLAALTSASDHALAALTWADVEDALASHPRIGERIARTGEAARDEDRESAWSRQEQAATATMDRAAGDELVAANRAYEERFGHVFLIRATGRSAEEMLSRLRARMDHDAATERNVVRSELAEIVRIRLAKAFR